MNQFFAKIVKLAKSSWNFLSNMNQSFANEKQIDKFRLNC